MEIVKPLAAKDPKSIGGFTLVGRLGAGGMGVVYLASRKSESVAIKVVRDSLIDDEVEATRFTREVSALEQIESPNVAKILEAGVDEGRAWFAVEFVNGPNLNELIQDKGPLSSEQWWELARGLLRGLTDVHRAGIIHRDIKPANVIIAEAGPKIIDFGIAHVSDATSVTATGLVAGSPAWFSPEQIEGMELAPSTDIFSAGSLLTFAATNSSPWGSVTTMTKASVLKILTNEPDLAGLDDAQTRLVLKMLEKNPAKRPTSESLLTNLEAIRAGKTIQLGIAQAVGRPFGNKETEVTESPRFNAGRKVESTSQTKKILPVSRDGGAKSRRKRNWLLAASVAVVAALGIFLVTINSAGSGTVSVSRQVIEMNPAIGDYSIRLSSGSIEPVTLNLAKGKSFPEVFAWKSDEPIRLSYTPPFNQDEPYEGIIFPRDLGLTGLSDGRPLFLHVSLEGSSTLISFRTGADSRENAVYAIRLARGHELEARAQCVRETIEVIDRESAPYTKLYDYYEESRQRANLDGERTLQYPTWASRAGNLISYLQEDWRNADSVTTVSEPSQALVEQIKNEHAQVVKAWTDFRSVAQRQADRDWDQAWQDVYDAEFGLLLATLGGPDGAARTYCNEIIQ